MCLYINIYSLFLITVNIIMCSTKYIKISPIQ